MLAFWLFLTLVGFSYTSQSCQFDDGEIRYDLRSLDKRDVTWSTPHDSSTWYFRPCQATSACSSSDPTAVLCEIDAEGNHYTGGYFQTLSIGHLNGNTSGVHNRTSRALGITLSYNGAIGMNDIDTSVTEIRCECSDLYFPAIVAVYEDFADYRVVVEMKSMSCCPIRKTDDNKRRAFQYWSFAVIVAAIVTVAFLVVVIL
ncbi:hypothetical protein GEMRC1_010023 [Eukaryota sp. GEM-RC1]